MHRQAVNRGRSTYELSCWAAAAHANPERFADCHWQSKLFWKRKTLAEQFLIFSAFHFGLIRMQIPALMLTHNIAAEQC